MPNGYYQLVKVKKHEKKVDPNERGQSRSMCTDNYDIGTQRLIERRRKKFASKANKKKPGDNVEVLCREIR